MKEQSEIEKDFKYLCDKNEAYKQYLPTWRYYARRECVELRAMLNVYRDILKIKKTKNDKI